MAIIQSRSKRSTDIPDLGAHIAASARSEASRSSIGRVMSEVRDSMAEIRCVGSERLMRAGVSMSHLHVMWMLRRHGELPMSRLAEMLDVSFSNATGLIDRMEERGLIERTRVPDDRRIVLVGLSPTGHQLLEQVDILGDDVLRSILDRLDERQLERLARAMQDVRRAVQAARDAGEFAGNTHHHEASRRPAPASTATDDKGVPAS